METRQTFELLYQYACAVAWVLIDGFSTSSLQHEAGLDPHSCPVIGGEATISAKSSL